MDKFKIIPFCSHVSNKYVKSTLGGQEACFSNFYPAQFSVRHIKIYQYLRIKPPNDLISKIQFETVEQGMMYGKAILFNDYKISEQIMATKNPKDARSLGRKVHGYIDIEWDAVRYQYVRMLIYEKFRQNADIRGILLSTGSATIVEAAHYDKIWGVGLHLANPNIMNPDKWQGTNLLGKCLMAVRGKLLKNINTSTRHLSRKT